MRKKNAQKTELLLIPEACTSWETPRRPDDRVMLELYRTYARKGAKLVKGGAVVRIASDSGQPLMEMSETELKVVQKLLARAATATFKALDAKADPQAAKLLAARTWASVGFVFRDGPFRLGVFMSESMVEGETINTQHILLELRGRSIELPHLDAFALPAK